MSYEITTGKVRVSFCHIFQKKKSEEFNTEQYEAMILIRKEDKKTVQAIKDKITELVESKPPKLKGKGLKALKLPLRDGDAEYDNAGDDEKSKKEYLRGHYYMNCTAQKQIKVYNRDHTEMVDPTQLYSGVYAQFVINFFPFDGNGKQYGVGAGMQACRKLEDGEPFGSVFTDEMAKERMTDDFDDYETGYASEIGDAAAEDEDEDEDEDDVW